MKKLLMMIGAAAVAVGANADTVTTNGVQWAYTVNNAANKTATLATGSEPVDGTTSVDASLIPWTFVADDGEEYTVTAIAKSAFQKKSWLVGQLTIPDEVTSIGQSAFEATSPGSLTGCVTIGAGVTSIGNYSFKNQKGITAVLVKGNVSSIGAQAFGWNTKLKNLIFTKLSTSATFGSDCFSNVTGANVFVPYGVAFPATDNNTIIYYGAGQSFDMSFDGDTVTVMPTDEESLTNAIAWATSPFKSVFGLDTVISITNSINASVAITEEMLNDVSLNVPTWYMTFAVKTQAQLDRVLAATTGPIVADITGATEEITPPVGRRVAILAPGGATFNYHKRGLVISFH